MCVVCGVCVRCVRCACVCGVCVCVCLGVVRSCVRVCVGVYVCVVLRRLVRCLIVAVLVALLLWLSPPLSVAYNTILVRRCGCRPSSSQSSGVNEIIGNAFIMNDRRLAARLRTLIYQRTSCRASAGVGPNMFLARCATGIAKPDGLHVIESIEDVRPCLRASVRVCVRVCA